MHSRAFVGILAIMWVFPAVTAAQNGGFAPGINPGWLHPVSPSVTERVVQPFGSVRSHNRPRVGGHIIPQATVVLVPSPAGGRVTAGDQRSVSRRGRVTHPFSSGRAVERGRGGHLPPSHPRPTTILQNATSAFLTVPSADTSHPAGPTVVVGMPRAHVLVRLGRPRATILSLNNETLVFSGATVIIQNGVVALIR